MEDFKINPDLVHVTTPRMTSIPSTEQERVVEIEHQKYLALSKKRQITVCCDDTKLIIQKAINHGITQSNLDIFIQTFNRHPFDRIGAAFRDRIDIRADLDILIDEIFQRADLLEDPTLAYKFLSHFYDLVQNQKRHSRAVIVVKKFNVAWKAKMSLNSMDRGPSNSSEKYRDQTQLAPYSTSSGADVIPIVFISYSHDDEEHKNWVLRLATRLRRDGVNVILDQWDTGLGSDLSMFMEDGLTKSDRVICVCSNAYVKKANEGKGGSGYEKQIISADLIIDQNTNRIIPLIRSNILSKKTPTFLAGKLYISFEENHLFEESYERLLRDIHKEPSLKAPPIGGNPFNAINVDNSTAIFPSANEKYASFLLKGKVTFDYSNNNGSYCIGQGSLMFELKFSKSSDNNIYIYSDAKSISTIAIAKGVKDIDEITDATKFDGSSRVRTPKVGELVVVQNMNGYFAVVKIISIKDDTRGDFHDEVEFQYIIRTDRSSSFT